MISANKKYPHSRIEPESSRLKVGCSDHLATKNSFKTGQAASHEIMTPQTLLNPPYFLQ